jgi:hypothetical protein
MTSVLVVASASATAVTFPSFRGSWSSEVGALP